MKKVFKLEDLDCAHCAQKMEDGIKKLDGVIDAKVNFIMQKMTLEAEDEKFEGVLQEAIRVCKKIEPDCRIIVK